MGPRMTLELIKIEDGIAAGEVLYHSIVHRTPQEVEQMNKRRDKKECDEQYYYCCHDVLVKIGKSNHLPALEYQFRLWLV